MLSPVEELRYRRALWRRSKIRFFFWSMLPVEVRQEILFLNRYALFDSVSYAERYLFGRLIYLAILHYVFLGKYFQYDPNPYFMARYYKKKYLQAAIDNPILHYWLQGQYLGNKTTYYQDAPCFFKMPVSKDYSNLERDLIALISGTRSSEKKRLCLYAHYDPESIIDSAVVHCIKAMADAGFEIVFISTSLQFHEKEFAKIACYCSRGIHKKNHGWDFGSWALAIKLHDNLQKYIQIVFTNDSFLGPLYENLPLIFKRMATKNLDVWSLVDYDSDKHYVLQSFFLCFNQKIIEDGFITNYFKRFVICPNKRWVVPWCEVGLTQLLISAGYRVAACYKTSEIKKRILQTTTARYALYRDLVRSGERCNVVISFWDFLVAEMQFPVVKIKSVLLSNRRIATVSPEFILKKTALRWSDIEKYIVRIKKYYTNYY